MRHRGGQVGNFFLAGEQGAPEFSAADEEMPERFASQSAVAVVNARGPISRRSPRPRRWASWSPTPAPGGRCRRTGRRTASSMPPIARNAESTIGPEPETARPNDMRRERSRRPSRAFAAASSSGPTRQFTSGASRYAGLLEPRRSSRTAPRANRAACRAKLPNVASRVEGRGCDGHDVSGRLAPGGGAVHDSSVRGGSLAGRPSVSSLCA